MKQKIDKWQRWINRIREQVTRLMMYRSYNQRYEAIVNKNPHLNKGNGFLVYFRAIYADFAAMAIRRQAKGHKDSVSLRDLLEDMKANPTALSRDWLREFYTQPGASGIAYSREQSDFLADSTYKGFADSSGTSLDPAKIDKDIAELETGTSKVVTYADRALAHDEKGGPRLDSELTFNEIDEAINAIEKVVKKYNPLLHGAAYVTLTPVDLTGSVDVFRIPWLPPQE